MVERLKVKVGEKITVGAPAEVRGTATPTEEGVHFVLEPITKPVLPEEPAPVAPEVPTVTLPKVPIKVPVIELPRLPAAEAPAPELPTILNPFLPAEHEATYPKTAPMPEDRPLIIDIETTGTDPMDSRLICIGLKDPLKPEQPVQVIMREDEEEMLRYFFQYFKIGGYNALIGYNLVFDYRYLWIKALDYMISCKEYHDAALHDIMQILTQVKEAFVYGVLPKSKLNDWAKYLLGMEKTMTIKEMLLAWTQKRYDAIKEYVINDVQIEFYLWALIEISRTAPISLGEVSTPTKLSGESTLTCPRCASEVGVSALKDGKYCPVCNYELK